MKEKKKILIVDDNPSIRTFLKVPLGAKYEIFEADSAESGLESFETNNPDLVILDLGLPDKDGFFVLENIRKENKETKILILTVRDDNDSRDKAKELGANHYITKPFRFEEIIEAIEELLK